jgi:hypothetical protein
MWRWPRKMRHLSRCHPMLFSLFYRAPGPNCLHRPLLYCTCCSRVSFLSMQSSSLCFLVLEISSCPLTTAPLVRTNHAALVFISYLLRRSCRLGNKIVRMFMYREIVVESNKKTRADVHLSCTSFATIVESDLIAAAHLN